MHWVTKLLFMLIKLVLSLEGFEYFPMAFLCIAGFRRSIIILQSSLGGAFCVSFQQVICVETSSSPLQTVGRYY